MPTRINFVKQFYKSKSLPLSSETLVNMYAEIQSDTSKSPIGLFGNSGLRELIDFNIASPVYALERMGNFLYTVVGNRFYQINDNFVATLKGTIPLTPNKIVLSVNNNGIEMVILTSVGRSWVYNSSADTFVEITDVDYQLASDVTSIDGYNVYSKQNSDQFFYCEVRTATVFDALDFQTAEGEPDNLVAIRKFQGGLWAFGERTLEFYKNTGGNPIFQRVGGASRGKGCLARDSVARIDDDAIFWLGVDKKIYAGSGYKPTRISTPPIEQELETYSNLDLQNAEAFTYVNEGHEFYVITFPDKNRTFSYDITTGFWAIRESFDGNNAIRWRANCFADYKGKRIIGDYSTGKLYYLDNTYYGKEGDNRTIAKIVISPLFADFNRATVSALYVDMETGVGATSGEGSDPKLMFRQSDDGGRTYSNERQIPIGALGKYKTRVKITQIGTADNYTFELRISDPIKRRVYAGYIEFRVGTV
jgi:hypothetical protein